MERYEAISFLGSERDTLPGLGQYPEILIRLSHQLQLLFRLS